MTRPLRPHGLRIVGRVLVFAIALGAVTAGCGDDPQPEAVVPVLELSTPWQAQPFRVRDDVIAAGLTACRGVGRDILPPNATIVLADVRGASRIDFLFTVPGNASGTCTVIASADGSFQFSTGGGGAENAGGQPAAGQVQISSMSSSSGLAANGVDPMSNTSVIGRAGPGVAGVDVILSTGRRIRATTANSWFAAWWPTDDTDIGIQAIGPDGQPMGPPQR